MFTFFQQAEPVVESNRPAPDWPQGGHVTFNHYATRYREGLDLVLKDIQCDVPSGTKVRRRTHTVDRLGGPSEGLGLKWLDWSFIALLSQ